MFCFSVTVAVCVCLSQRDLNPYVETVLYFLPMCRLASVKVCSVEACDIVVCLTRPGQQNIDAALKSIPGKCLTYIELDKAYQAYVSLYLAYVGQIDLTCAESA